MQLIHVKILFIVVLMLQGCVVETGSHETGSHKTGYDFKFSNLNDNGTAIDTKKTSYDAQFTDSLKQETKQDTTKDNSLIRIGEGAKKNIWVMDQNGNEVGVLVSRGVHVGNNGDINDIVTVFNPDAKIFFNIRMSDGTVAVPQKVIYTNQACSGDIYIYSGSTGVCNFCFSGFSNGFEINGHWYKIKGGQQQGKKTISYLSYIQAGFEKKCAYHTGNTYVYDLIELTDNTLPTTFSPPLFFAWR